MTPAEIAPSAFTREAIERGEPLVLRGFCADWPLSRAAAQSWEAACAYLLRFDSGRTAQAFTGAAALAGRYHYGAGPDGFNFERETMGIAPMLARVSAAAEAPGGATTYMGSLPVEDYFPGLDAENAPPPLIAKVQPRIWIGNASVIACHYDSFENLACVAAGRRRFTLFPPDAIGDLYVGPIDHTMAGQPVGLAVGSEPGDLRYPRFEAARGRAVTVDLEAGDALYLPKLWWHQVEATGPANILVNYWWDAFQSGADTPYAAMMLAMIAIAERPAPERAAWRAFFDHYVFRPNGHPLAHLPAEKHGILGPLGSGNYGRIRAAVMRMLRGE